MKLILAMIVAGTMLAGCGANVTDAGGPGWTKELWRDLDRAAPGGE